MGGSKGDLLRLFGTFLLSEISRKQELFLTEPALSPFGSLRTWGDQLIEA